MTDTVLTARHLSAIRMVMTGRMSLDLVLTIPTMELAGVVGGQPKRKDVDLEKVFQLLGYIETLALPTAVVPPGKLPRGATTFHLLYEDGTTLLLGMNLNEAGLEYLELETDQFQRLMDLWAALAT